MISQESVYGSCAIDHGLPVRMASCNYSTLVGGTCGSSTYNPSIVQCVTISECSKEVANHLTLYKISDDEGVSSESKLLLARAGKCEHITTPFRCTSSLYILSLHETLETITYPFFAKFKESFIILNLI